MSELTRIVVCIVIALFIVYGVVIWFSVNEGTGIGLYITCITLNVVVGLWFWYMATRPDNDTQAGMGLGPMMIICGLTTVILPLIAIIAFFIRKLFKV